ncbi:MAG: hypothetical protein ACE5IZ_10300, partial [Dehalococcoidia bacterium]
MAEGALGSHSGTGDYGLARPSAMPLLHYTLGALAVAGLGELFLLRVLSRVGVHIPKEGPILYVYGFLTEVGSFAFNLAAVLAVMAASLAAWLVLRRRPGVVSALAAWTLVGLAAGDIALALVGKAVAAEAAFALGTTAALLLLALPYVFGNQTTQRRLAVALVVGAYMGSQYYGLAHALYNLLGLRATPPQTTLALGLGEGLLLAAGFTIFWAWGRGNANPRVAPLASAALVLALMAAYVANGSTTAILALWTEGVALLLPSPSTWSSLAYTRPRRWHVWRATT